MRFLCFSLMVGLFAGVGYGAADVNHAQETGPGVMIERPARVITVRGEGEFKKIDDQIFLVLTDGKKYLVSAKVEKECTPWVGKGKVKFYGNADDTPGSDKFNGVLRTARTIEPAGSEN